jgi:hypothetical protein
MKSRFIVSLDIAQDTLAQRVLRLDSKPPRTITITFHEHDVRFGGFAQFQHATQIGETIAASQFERFERSASFDELRTSGSWSRSW